MLASLPMYDLPEIHEATDRFWQTIAASYGVEGPLSRGEKWSAPWHDPNLLFSQTCGYPFTHEFAGKLTYVATPLYDADGCDGPNYCSIIFARTVAPLATFTGSTVAFNSSDSMSGYLALRLVFAPYPTDFASGVETGSHVASLAAVQRGVADVCAIDCVTVALLRKHRPSALDGLQEVARSPKVPGLPFVTRSGDKARLQQALISAVQSRQANSALLINGLSILSPEHYNVIIELEKSIDGKSIIPKA
jgi:ABC-type phosphate/phosphonate transport system substrate-binding protein